MNKPHKIILDPHTAVNYASYYLIGLKKCYPGVNLKWDASRFPYKIHNLNEFRQGVGVILEYRDSSKKIYIDFHDLNTVLEGPYNWCDIYAKINVQSADCKRSKVIPIGPSFGVRYKNLMSSVLDGLINYIKLSDRGWKPSFKEYMRGYLYTFVRRKSYKKYIDQPKEKEGYIFAVSTLWYDAKTDQTTNNFRAQFSRLCKELMPIFEGGLYLIGGKTTIKEFPKYAEYSKIYGDLIINNRVPMKEYIEKTSQSAFVFNTPSVQGCHGWKLAEYLAMGKAIISTPLENVLPGEFRDGIEYIRVDSLDEMENAIILLRDQHEVREKLKKNAKDYFDSYLSPDTVIRRIVNHDNN